MQIKSLLIFAALGLGVCATQGCRTVDQNAGETLIKPLGYLPGSARESQSYDERQVCLETAASVAAEGHYTEAIKLYEKAEELGGSDPSLDHQLASLYAKLGEYQKAVDRYEKIIEDGEESAEVLNNLAWTFYESNQLEDAYRVASEGLEKFPNDERLTAGSALMAYRLGDRELALNRFTSLYGAATAYHNVALLDLEYGSVKDAMQLVSVAKEMKDCPQETHDLFLAIQAQMN